MWLYVFICPEDIWAGMQNAHAKEYHAYFPEMTIM